ncbi:MAG: Cellobiose 2-epimerase [Verrucomicrobiota bacterium]
MHTPVMSRRRFAGSLAVAGAALCSPPVARAAANPFVSFAAEAAAWRRHLVEVTVPYWIGTVDPIGGYALADDAARGRSRPLEKQVVSQARMVWGLSLAHRRGLCPRNPASLHAAQHGILFMRSRMKDPVYGGYYFAVQPDGSPRDPRKLVYGQAFVIYALVEWFRASGDRSALVEALEMYRVLQRKAHDHRFGGWMEHFNRDWTPLPPRAPDAIVEVAGLKSANTHLHLLEAFTELYIETQDRDVRASLAEAIQINQRRFYPHDAAFSAFHFHPDWSPVNDPASAGLSYGHNVEFAWLMIRAEEALGRRPSWSHFHAHMEHCLRCGTDHARGGIYNRGVGNAPAHDTSKVWWAQAEWIAALTDGLRDKPGHPPYANALLRVLAFMRNYGTDRRTGIWLDTVAADGAPRSTGLAHAWKTIYHDTRGLLKFSEAFAHT